MFRNKKTVKEKDVTMEKGKGKMCSIGTKKLKKKTIW